MIAGISWTKGLLALAFAALGAGTAVGVMLWEPWEDGGSGARETEPSTAPRLTVQEAIGLVANDCQNTGLSLSISGDAKAAYEGDGQWRVWVVVGEEVNRWTVDESTSAVIPLGENKLAAVCREQSESSQGRRSREGRSTR